jgi:hypothetical protein
VIERLPEDWLEEFHGELRVRSNQRKHVPQTISVAPDGLATDSMSAPTPALFQG